MRHMSTAVDAVRFVFKERTITSATIAIYTHGKRLARVDVDELRRSLFCRFRITVSKKYLMVENVARATALAVTVGLVRAWADEVRAPTTTTEYSRLLPPRTSRRR
jgi:hypothetical protein